ncbi:co-chaperone GroES [Candidatus Falkowbacteria bacterium RIFCSPLOWO2_12_FULL_45_10]|uniref:Co-chaperonin GroES n=2 Tax=Candidatus Falkowiibacteriota TaxID=1752728 RepID=A0A1F5RWP1_9BACT|nr:MAG: co-chaperone GroES [Candidatus Falkowbacteria bacterium RIFCSPLOWO2_12_FULL_45_10]OGF19994.1 MAG: co-chaperone GroES [Candidatus Falkowbacteria bacterium RIFCSPLOWO2_02_FULL_45_15]
MQIKPLNDKVVVKASSKEEKTRSGIVLPDTADKERPEQGEVIAVGPGKLLDNGSRAPMSVKPGDKVLFKKYSPDEFKIEQEEFLVLSEGEIIGIIE